MTAMMKRRGTTTVSQRPILLVEDNPDDVALTLRAMHKAGIVNEIVVCEDGAAALERLHGPGCDLSPALVLLDLKLPKVGGLEVLRAIRGHERTAMLPVVVLTTSKEERDLTGCYQLGANSYIQKPVDFNRFADAVAQIGVYWLLLNEQPPSPRER